MPTFYIEYRMEGSVKQCGLQLRGK